MYSGQLKYYKANRKAMLFDKLRAATARLKPLPAWKHNLLLDSFKQCNSKPREVLR